MGVLSEVRIPFGTRDLPAALAVPTTDLSSIPARPLAAVIVVHELFGLTDDIRSIASRFADAGYVALAPDFLSGLGPQPLCIARFARGLNRIGSGRPYRQLEAVRAWLASRPDVDASRIGVAGFCIGGGLALLYAASADDVAVVAPFYAPVPDDAETTLARICPVVASYGGRDGFFGSMAGRLQTALTVAGIDHDVKTYPEAGHSFMNRHGGLTGWIGARIPMHAGYVPNAADDAWRRVLAFFDRHLMAHEAEAG